MMLPSSLEMMAPRQARTCCATAHGSHFEPSATAAEGADGQTNAVDSAVNLVPYKQFPCMSNPV
jgi:hypothetical protein